MKTYIVKIKDEAKQLTMDDYVNLFAELEKLIDDFDKKHRKELKALMQSKEWDEDAFDQSGPTTGSHLAFEYMKDIKGE